MKRELDLARRLLLDIENQGSDCSLSALHSSLAQESDERVRYHLSLLIDAGFVKEVDRTSSGIPCVRLTNAGQEMIELARCESRWCDAKQLVMERTGGQSLTVIRSVLTRWAVDAVARTAYAREPQLRRSYHLARPSHHRDYRVADYRAADPIYRAADSSARYENTVRYDSIYSTVPVAQPVSYEPLYRVDSHQVEREPIVETNEPRVVHTRPDYRERYDGRDYYDRELQVFEDQWLEQELETGLPAYMI